MAAKRRILVPEAEDLGERVDHRVVLDPQEGAALDHELGHHGAPAGAS